MILNGHFLCLVDAKGHWYNFMAKRADYLGVLQTAITMAHNCHSTHRGTILVREASDNDETLWEGRVELFGLLDHKKGKNCYVWQRIDGEGRTKIFSVLENKFIASAQAAVHATISSNIQPVHAGHAEELELSQQGRVGSDRWSHETQINTEDLETVFQSLFKREVSPVGNGRQGRQRTKNFSTRRTNHRVPSLCLGRKRSR